MDALNPVPTEGYRLFCLQRTLWSGSGWMSVLWELLFLVGGKAVQPDLVGGNIEGDDRPQQKRPIEAVLVNNTRGAGCYPARRLPNGAKCGFDNHRKADNLTSSDPPAPTSECHLPGS